MSRDAQQMEGCNGDRESPSRLWFFPALAALFTKNDWTDDEQWLDMVRKIIGL
jgi:hypothetical protein